MALHLRNNKALGTVSEGAGTEKPQLAMTK